MKAAITRKEREPWWMIDFGLEGVPIKEVLIIGRIDHDENG